MQLKGDIQLLIQLLMGLVLDSLITASLVTYSCAVRRLEFQV